MRFSRRIPFLIGAPILGLMLLLLTATGRAITISAQTSKSRGPTNQVRATLAAANRTPTISPQTPNAAASAGAVGQNPPAAGPATTAAEAWNEGAEALAAKIIEHATSGKALALSVKNISSLGDEDVAQIRRALRSRLRSQGARLTGSKQANIDVQVTLSENPEGYLWIAEIRDHSSPSAPGADLASLVVMVSVERPNPGERQSTAAPLSILKTRIYQQADPMLDVALLESPAGGPSAPAGSAARVLVLGLANVSIYEEAAAPENGGNNGWQWRPVQSAPITRLRPWPRDARGRIIVRNNGRFDVYVPGSKCSGALAPALTLECHESEEPWPLNGGEREGNSANSGAWIGPAAYFMPDRNFFDGRVKFDDGREIKTLPFLAAVVMPLKAATHAGLPTATGRVPPGAASVPGLLFSGLDGRAQLLNGNAEPVANVGGWGSQIVGLQSSCGSGWQVLATQARDLNEPDAVQAYEIVNRKPVPVSTSLEFAGPITELWPLADGTEALAISHNLQTDTYEAFRLSVSCGQ